MGEPRGTTTAAKLANFLSSHFFYDATFGSEVATPQFNVLEHLDQPWGLPENLLALHKHWRDISDAMDKWACKTDEGVLPPKPGA